ncbi:hypothetical protein PGH47_42940 (plasmid) [Streptomyces sp. HUAS 31]|uniref:hypothetical protein n=1 Tax=Streptomyces TaxID=1883 RepID=UPI0023061531|nr:hypothetical protein [Streptomyces sp. HUAS 31]WCE02505.1 hypothetical protein PGH47_42940 [Streptomyces sp. HUAS 31]
MTTPLHQSPHPLTFVAQSGGEGSPRDGEVAYHIEVMGLGGFQKEGLARDVRSDRTWRLVCDEGAYLNGANMAPAPLAYWVGGLHADITARIAEAAREAGVVLDDLAVTVTQGFGVQGSFAKGEAVAQVHHMTCDVDLTCDQDDATVNRLVEHALGKSSAMAAVGGAHEGLFSLSTNGKATPVRLPVSTEPLTDPFLRHAQQPEPAETRPEAVPVAHPEGDKPPVMLSDDNDGTVSWRIRTDGGLDPATGLVASHVWFSENSATWTLVSDPANQAAPDPLVYFAIGTAFCFHTQLCRYATIRRLPVDAPRLAQLSRFPASGFKPLDTCLFLNGQLSEDDATNLMTAAANTCYAHRALTVAVEQRVTTTHKRAG